MKQMKKMNKMTKNKMTWLSCHGFRFNEGGTA